MLRRSRFLASAARTIAKEANRPELQAVAKVEPVPARGVEGGHRRGAVAELIAHYGLYAALAASVVAFFLPALDRLGSTKAIVELVVGVVLLVEGSLLVANWHGARWRIVRRRVTRRGEPAGALDAMRWRLLGYGLFLVGLAWVALGVVELAQGLLDL